MQHKLTESHKHIHPLRDGVKKKQSNTTGVKNKQKPGYYQY